MRVALTGSSSTGKTTIAQSLMGIPWIRDLVSQFVPTDARQLLREMGFSQMDRMTREQLRVFQRRYFDRKLALESSFGSLITDRSFVDVAAYWLVRDAFDLPVDQRMPLVQQCRTEAARYDLHIYVPFGQIPFEHDGYRSEHHDLHIAIDSCIQRLLSEWKLKPIWIRSGRHEDRVTQLKAALGEFKS